MGHHYLPQRYLRGFEVKSCPGKIWMFDKYLKKLAPIKTVAQEAGFYTAEIEEQLNKEVEVPANPVIDKLIQLRQVSISERLALATYVAVMLTRVPAYRQHTAKLAPEVLSQAAAELRDRFKALRYENPAADAIIQRRSAELEALELGYLLEMPKEVTEEIRKPWPAPEIRDLVVKMTWRVLKTSGPNYFITSDNPAFLFNAYGLKDADSELSFPLATDTALHCSWKKPSTGSDLLFLTASQAITKELNRRQASAAARFVFYHEDANWIQKLLTKVAPRLCKIQW